MLEVDFQIISASSAEILRGYYLVRFGLTANVTSEHTTRLLLTFYQLNESIWNHTAFPLQPTNKF